MMAQALTQNGVDLKDTLALSSRLKALETVAKPERNTEGWMYLVASVAATVALCMGMIDDILWAAIVLGNNVAYGVGRTLLKKGGNGK